MESASESNRTHTAQQWTNDFSDCTEEDNRIRREYKTSQRHGLRQHTRQRQRQRLGCGTQDADEDNNTKAFNEDGMNWISEMILALYAELELYVDIGNNSISDGLNLYSAQQLFLIPQPERIFCISGTITTPRWQLSAAESQCHWFATLVDFMLPKPQLKSTPRNSMGLCDTFSGAFTLWLNGSIAIAVIMEINVRW